MPQLERWSEQQDSKSYTVRRVFITSLKSVYPLSARHFLNVL